MGFSGCPRDITSKTETLARAGFGATSVNCPRDIASQDQRVRSPVSPAGTAIRPGGEVASSSSAFRFFLVFINT